MTFERKCFIHPGDINAIEMECKKCHYRAVRPLENWLQESLQCPNCGAIWMVGGSEPKNIKQLVNVIRSLAEVHDLPFTLRLEINCPEMTQ